MAEALPVVLLQEPTWSEGPPFPLSPRWMCLEMLLSKKKNLLFRFIFFALVFKPTTKNTQTHTQTYTHMHTRRELEGTTLRLNHSFTLSCQRSLWKWRNFNKTAVYLAPHREVWFFFLLLKVAAVPSSLLAGILKWQSHQEEQQFVLTACYPENKSPHFQKCSRHLSD